MSELGAAARDGDIARMQQLVASGADSSVVGAQGGAHLPAACWPPPALRSRAPAPDAASHAPSPADESGMTPLMWAVDRGQTEAAAALLDAGVNADATDPDG